MPGGGDGSWWYRPQQRQTLTPPPPPLVSSAISLLCVALNAWVFITNGRAASAMAVATFMVLSLQLLAVQKPRFSQLASSVFGLFYCGARVVWWRGGIGERTSFVDLEMQQGQ